MAIRPLPRLTVGADKTDNLAKVAQYVKQATFNGAHIVVLPECFNSPYRSTYFETYAEPIPGGETTTKLSEMAKGNSVFIVGGSIPERDGNALYNTCTVWNPDGELIALFRKIHLFDMNMPGCEPFSELKDFSPGSSLATFTTPFCQFGLRICHDLRFPELAQLDAEQGCQLLLYPSAFNMTTGSSHWELLLRARAVDNQLYVAAVSPARDTDATYITWGHSSVTSPWGEVVASIDEKESIVYADIGNRTPRKIQTDFNCHYLKKNKNWVTWNKYEINSPIIKQKRRNLYTLSNKP